MLIFFEKGHYMKNKRTVAKISIKNVPQDYIDLCILLRDYFDFNKKRIVPNINSLPNLGGVSPCDYFSVKTYSIRTDNLIQLANFCYKNEGLDVKDNEEIDNILIEIVSTDNLTGSVEQDVFNFGYLQLIKKLYFKNDAGMYLDCFILIGFNKYKFANQLAGYLIDEDYNHPTIFTFDDRNNRIQNVNRKFDVSIERLPTLFIHESNKVYDILRNPLYTTSTQFIENYKRCNTNSTLDNNFTELLLRLFKKSVDEFICRITNNFYPIECWETLTNKFFERATRVPTIVLIMFAMQFHVSKAWKSIDRWQDDMNEHDKVCVCEKYINAAFDAMDFVFDYSDGILQIIENAISYSQGAVFSIRLYDENADKYLSEYKFSDGKKSLFRISLIDISNASIIETIKTRKNIKDQLALKQIFCSENIEHSSNNYYNYVDDMDSRVHHYGLPLFSNIVLSRGGIFRVISSSKSNTSYYHQVQHDEAMYLFRNEITCAIPKNNNAEMQPHISGTDYDILVPLFSFADIKKENNIHASILSLLPVRNYGYKKGQPLVITRLQDFFTNEFNSIVKNQQAISFQKRKESSIDEAAEILIEKIKKIIKEEDKPYIICFDCSTKDKNILPYSRIEIIAKTIFKIIGNMSLIHFAILTRDGYEISRFVRQFVCFYDRVGENTVVAESQVFFYSPSDNSEALLGGTTSISSMYAYNQYMRFFCGVPTNIEDALKIVSRRFDSEYDKNQLLSPLPFEDLLLDENNSFVQTLGESIISKKLHKILESDIHKYDLGCKLSKTHIRLNGVHLDRFYEAQFLFGNQYWIDRFAEHLFDIVSEQHLKNKKDKMVLIGYEVYIEPVIYALNLLLNNRKFDCDYIIYENAKYIRRNKRGDAVVRHLQKDIDSSNTNFFFIVGISTTLRTFLEMAKQIHSQDDKIVFTVDNTFLQAILQVNPNENSSNCYTNPNSQNFLDIDRKNHEITNANIRKLFANTGEIKKVKYIFELLATWYDPSNCPLCFPENVLASFVDEKYLVETDESSVVPLQLISLEQHNNQNKMVALKDTRIIGKIGNIQSINGRPNYDYLYYDHIDRGDNHFHYYIRTSSLIKDLLHKSKGNSSLVEWLKSLKSKLFAENAYSPYDINILVGPLHYSNETFMCAVNQYVFDNNGYIVNFDIRKEYRSNFEAKYSNHSAVLDLIRAIKHQSKYINPKINCYYIDDQIITGNTFTRAKNLINSSFQKLLKSELDSLELNVFKAIIVFMDQHSDASRAEFLQCGLPLKSLPYYSYIELKMPSLRSYGDSCPLCAKLARIKNIKSSSLLWGMENHWDKKENYHRIKSTQEARNEIENKKEAERQIIQVRNFRRIQCENTLWNEIRNNESNSSEAMSYIMKLLQDVLDLEVDNNELKNTGDLSSSHLKVEYLISYLKIMSRPVISYREYVRDAVFKVLLNMLNAFENKYIKQDISSLSKFEKSLFDLLDLVCGIDKSQQREDAKKSNYVLDLFKVLVARLCSLDSCCFLNYSRIENCRQIANMIGDEDGEFDLHLWYNLKKLLFGYKDFEVKTKVFNEKVLNKVIEENGRKLDDFWSIAFLECPSAEDRAEKIFDFSQRDLSVTNFKTRECIKKILKDSRIGFYVRDGNKRFVYIAGDNIIFSEDKNISSMLEQIGYQRLSDRYIILKFGDKSYNSYKQDIESMDNDVTSVYMKIYFDNIESEYDQLCCLRKFLAASAQFKNAINRDFNNNALEAKVQTEKLANVLSSKKVTTHGEWDDVNKLASIIDVVYENERKVLDDGITVFNNMLVAYVFRAIAHMSLSGDESNMTFAELNQNITLSSALFTEDKYNFIINYLENKKKIADKDYQITLMDNFNTVPYDNKFNGLSISPAANQGIMSTLLCVIDLLIANIFKHGLEWGKVLLLKVPDDELCKRKQIICESNIQKNSNGQPYQNASEVYDLVIVNNCKNNKDTAIDNSNGMTLTALKYIFNSYNEFQPSIERVLSYRLNEENYHHLHVNECCSLSKFNEKMKSYLNFKAIDQGPSNSNVYYAVIENAIFK